MKVASTPLQLEDAADAECRQLDPLERQDPTERMALMVSPEHPVRTDLTDHQPLLLQHTTSASTALMDLPDLPETQDPRDPLEIQEPMDSRELPDRLEPPDLRDHLAHPETTASLEILELLALPDSSTRFPVQMDLLDHLDHKDHLDLMDSLETTVNPGNQDLKDLPEIMEQLELLVNLELTETMAQMERLDQLVSSILYDLIVVFPQQLTFRRMRSLPSTSYCSWILSEHRDSLSIRATEPLHFLFVR